MNEINDNDFQNHTNIVEEEFNDNNDNSNHGENNENLSNNNESSLAENNISNINNSNHNINTEANNINEILNNNIIENNIIDNNNLDNNNIINNENNINDNNDSINIPEIEEDYDPQFTFSFKILLILNTLGYMHSFLKTYELKNYSLCLWPIANKAQYYRMITSHFYHFGFFDYLTTMIGLFFATKYLEPEIGSIYTILIVFHGIIITSLFYLITMWLFKTILRFLEYNFIYQSGFSSIDFCLYLSYFLLKKNYRRNISLSFIDLRGIHSVYFVILIFQLITPSASIILNLCGTLSAFIIFKICKYFTLPRNYWINETEKILGLSGNKNCCFKSFLGYYSISENETILNNVREFDFFLDNINKSKSMIIDDIKSKNKKKSPSEANNNNN